MTRRLFRGREHEGDPAFGNVGDFDNDDIMETRSSSISRARSDVSESMHFRQTSRAESEGSASYMMPGIPPGGLPRHLMDVEGGGGESSTPPPPPLDTSMIPSKDKEKSKRSKLKEVFRKLKGGKLSKDVKTPSGSAQPTPTFPSCSTGDSDHASPAMSVSTSDVHTPMSGGDHSGRYTFDHSFTQPPPRFTPGAPIHPTSTPIAAPPHQAPPPSRFAQAQEPTAMGPEASEDTSYLSEAPEAQEGTAASEAEMLKKVMEESLKMAEERERMAAGPTEEEEIAELEKALEESRQMAQLDEVLRESRLMRAELEVIMQPLQEYHKQMIDVRADLTALFTAQGNNRTRRQLTEVETGIKAVEENIHPLEAAIKRLNDFETFVVKERPGQAEVLSLKGHVVSDIILELDKAGLSGILTSYQEDNEQEDQGQQQQQQQEEWPMDVDTQVGSDAPMSGFLSAPNATSAAPVIAQSQPTPAFDRVAHGMSPESLQVPRRLRTAASDVDPVVSLPREPSLTTISEREAYVPQPQTGFPPPFLAQPDDVIQHPETLDGTVEQQQQDASVAAMELTQLPVAEPPDSFPSLPTLSQPPPLEAPPVPEVPPAAPLSTAPPPTTDAASVSAVEAALRGIREKRASIEMRLMERNRRRGMSSGTSMDFSAPSLPPPAEAPVLPSLATFSESITIAPELLPQSRSDLASFAAIPEEPSIPHPTPEAHTGVVTKPFLGSGIRGVDEVAVAVRQYDEGFSTAATAQEPVPVAVQAVPSSSREANGMNQGSSSSTSATTTGGRIKIVDAYRQIRQEYLRGKDVDMGPTPEHSTDEVRQPQDPSSLLVSRLGGEISEAKFNNMTEVTEFVRNIESNLTEIKDRSILLLSPDWPTDRYDALVESVQLQRELGSLVESQQQIKPTNGDFEDEIAHVTSQLESTAQLMEIHDSNRYAFMKKVATHGIPFDPVAYTQVRHASRHLALFHMNVVLCEVAHMELEDDGEGSMSETILQMLTDSLRTTFKYHAFAGSFDRDCQEHQEKINSLVKKHLQIVLNRDDNDSKKLATKMEFETKV